MSDRALRNDTAANVQMAARASVKPPSRPPMVRRSAWQEFMPQNAGEVSACWLLSAVIACEVIFLAGAIAWR